MHQGNFRVFGTESTGLCIYLKFSSVSTFQGTGVTIPVCLVLKAPFLVLFKDIDVFLHSHVSPALALRSLVGSVLKYDDIVAWRFHMEHDQAFC